MKLAYLKDKFSKDILLHNDGTQIMMEWEKPYMEACIDKLNPYGRVLEIGFGLGYSANHIQTYKNVEEHVIVECAPIVWKKMIPFLEKYPKAKLEKGRWQDILSELGKFDCIFFDDCPDEVSRRLKLNFQDFLKEIFLNHTNMGARLVCYCGRHIEVETSKISLEIEQYKIAVPSNCRYANKLYIPLFIKKDNMNEKDLQNLIRPYSVMTQLQPVEEIHFNNKELLFNTILTLNREKKYDKLNALCRLYLKNNTEDDRQRKRVQHFLSSLPQGKVSESLHDQQRKVIHSAADSL